MNNTGYLGIFLCRCGNSISKVLDIRELASRVGKLPDVAFCYEHPSLCLPDGKEFIREKVTRAGVQKVLIAACTPRTHEGLLLSATASAELDWRMVEMVDIREGCAWIHASQPREASKKAWHLLRMGIDRARLREPFRDVSLPIRPTALVAGGGPAGMTAALNLARQGFQTTVVERDGELGGMLRRIDRVYPADEPAGEMLAAFKTEMEGQKGLDVKLSSRIREIQGFVGNFSIKLDTPSGKEHIRSGVIILATGARAYRPEGLFRYGELPNVITQMELEGLLKKGHEREAQHVVFIQCVGSRIKERLYCSSICCPITLKNAFRLSMSKSPGAISVLHRDMMTPGIELERCYHKAMDAGVRFFRYDPARPPVIEGKERAERIVMYDEPVGKELILKADLVVLSAPLVSHRDNSEIVRTLRIREGQYGFFADSNLMEPGSSLIDGVYICGSARWPVSIHDGMIQAKAVASKAASLLGAGRIPASHLGRVPGTRVLHAFVRQEACSGCGACARTCPYNACVIQQWNGRGVARVNKARCKGCGTCAAACPSGAIQQVGYADRQMLAMINAAY